MDWDLRLERAAGIELREVTDGYVAYDSLRDRLHFLNPTAMLLLEACDGRLAARDLPPLLAEAYRLAEPPTAEVERCIDKLLSEGLLVPSGEPLARS
jgi:hypothetical protein